MNECYKYVYEHLMLLVLLQGGGGGGVKHSYASYSMRMIKLQIFLAEGKHLFFEVTCRNGGVLEKNGGRSCINFGISLIL